MSRGIFIAFEGIDGSGKSTQIQMLTNRIQQEGIRCYQTCEPSSGPIGSLTRQILTGRIKTDNRVIAAMFAADRLDHLLNNVDGIVAKVEEGTLLETDYSYIVPYGELECYFNENGKLAIVKDNYNTATYSWATNNIYITDKASNTNIVRLSGGKPIYITVSRFDAATNSTLSKNVQYEWTDGVITKFTNADGVAHEYTYTNGLLTENETETIIYSAEGRVKKITQPNGAFVKYTYNDTAASADEETPGNIGAVTVSDSKGVTDVWYYADDLAHIKG